MTPDVAVPRSELGVQMLSRELHCQIFKKGIFPHPGPCLRRGDAELGTSGKRWEVLTSANAFADVAHLHCGIEMDKEVRNDFMTPTTWESLEYSPIRSSFLTVNESWKEYPESAERKYKELEDHQISDSVPNVGGEDRRFYESARLVPPDPEGGSLSSSVINSTLPLLLKVPSDGHPLRRDKTIGWHHVADGDQARLTTGFSKKVLTSLNRDHGARAFGVPRKLDSADDRLALAISLCRETLLVNRSPSKKVKKVPAAKPTPVYWPALYWGLTKPKRDLRPGTIDLSVRTRIALRLLRLSWLGCPLFNSREPGWTFRVPRASELNFYQPNDEHLKGISEGGGFVFEKLPHKVGENMVTMGTGDLHSKTASVLGISRDQAKVFDYSRIYGAGMRHAVLLLMQTNEGMLPEQAQALAERISAQTKGKNTHRQALFGRKFWYGGTESSVFNKLEEIALSDSTRTPALGCGITPPPKATPLRSSRRLPRLLVL
ncbi:hypothetical protein GLOTRDRAFT_95994 [Gloeophyllum trabeum ATCC 11539]|uniref:Mitochondrial DNA polymerase catalytic subunit n=1 Tax=Gloeophyllum trabeum (strain ATCC 11539 / FP-39264 / Madison 617) TaxID=670483 RepID=S7PWI3_GLOTA|nr:uncharacterized protein GLOTRDRAFT_95994 [Gloeophyllum trabeum ATCC 11539]EPQ51712.1 hypothetical protein GLOTRDRAFT_95994 [Gloeophyllum trabeum ATCC 11539]